RLPAGGSHDQIPLMIQALLADRFKLEFHRATKILPQYELVIAKGGPKLEVAGEDDRKRSRSSSGDRQIKGWGLPISSLVVMLIGAVGAPVLDHTGLLDKYNFVLEFAPVFGKPAENEPLPTIFAALPETLGLKLESIRAPMEVMVIDRADRP